MFTETADYKFEHNTVSLRYSVLCGGQCVNECFVTTCWGSLLFPLDCVEEERSVAHGDGSQSN